MADPILLSLPVSQLRVNHEWNVRRGSAAGTDLESLRDSIASQGVLQPIDVQRQGETYAVVAGFRRATLSIELSAEETAAGRTERRVPAIVRQLNEAEARALNLTENLGRKSLRPNELARGLEGFAKAAPTETQDRIAKRFGISPGYVSHLLKIRSKGSPELLAFWDSYPESSVDVLYEACAHEKSKQLGELRQLLKGTKSADKSQPPIKLALPFVQKVLRAADLEAGKKPSAWRDGCAWAFHELGLAAKAPGKKAPAKKAPPKKATPKKAPKR